MFNINSQFLFQDGEHNSLENRFNKTALIEMLAELEHGKFLKLSENIGYKIPDEKNLSYRDLKNDQKQYYRVLGELTFDLLSSWANSEDVFYLKEKIKNLF
jgi:hypothetical protein